MNRFQVKPVEIKDGTSTIAENGEIQINVTNLVSPNNNKKTSKTSVDNKKLSFAQRTREALPRLDNYRLSIRALKRPSIGILHGETIEQFQETVNDPEAHGLSHSGIKLGWIQGVLIPCLLNIWGVMLFLRLAWVLSLAGIGESFLIIAISTTVCVITTLSLSAISTNGQVKGGGIYFIISRSLGPEFGASVGIVFAFANAVAASMNTIGFCSSLNDLLRSFDTKIIDGDLNDIRIVGTVALAIMIVICAVGMEWESKAQNFLIAIIVAAIFNFIIGASIGPRNDEDIAQGFVGLSLETFAANWGPDYRYSEKRDQNFFSVFAIFFPAVTGIQAGANISGDLKDPSSSIPKGTLLSIAISMTSYAIFIVFAGGAAVRDASGNVTDLINGTMVGVTPNCLENFSCEYGLHNSYTIMQLMAAWGPLIYAGCFAATLSTALTNLLSVPRLVQALGIDRIYPGLIFFSKGYGKHGEPYRGYVLTFIISTLFLLIADLNAIAPLISNFYLASYALINFCTFHAAFIKPLGWRPTFKYYNVWLSLFGFAICVMIMFLIDWISSLITFIIIFALYLIVMYRKPDVNWGSSTQAQTYKTALTNAYRLQHIGDHVKNYRPQVLVLTGSPQSRPPLVDLANLITKNNSLMMIGHIFQDEISYKKRIKAIKEGEEWLAARKVKSFYNIVEGLDFHTGARALMQSLGVGKLSPNLLLIGYKQEWQKCELQDLSSYFTIMHNAFSNRLALAILRLPNGLDYSHINHEVNPAFTNGDIMARQISVDTLGLGDGTGELSVKVSTVNELLPSDSNLNLAGMVSSNSTLTEPQPPPFPNQKLMAKLVKQENIVYSTRGGSTVSKAVLNEMGVFHIRQPKGTIDVWWLYDDGGLTILIPYILSRRSNWANCKIRIFALTTQKLDLEVEEKNMANLLHKLRIDYSSLTMLQGMNFKPKLATISLFNQILDGFDENKSIDQHVTESEKLLLQEKTYRQLRLRELLLEHSTDASLIVMSLPMPRQDAISAPFYMAWLEVLTRNMPPFLLIRGNQSSVLTFYS